MCGKKGRNQTLRKPCDGASGTVADSLKTASASAATIRRCHGSASSWDRDRDVLRRAWRAALPRAPFRAGGVDRDRITRGSRRFLAGSCAELVREWADLHRAELDEDWRRAREG